MLKELHEQAITEDEFAALIEREGDALHLTEIRTLMIRRKQIEREREQVSAIRDAVVATYNDKLSRLDYNERMIRLRLEGFVHAHGTTSFPDVGTAYMREVDPKIDVEDTSAANRWAKENGFTKAAPDLTAAKKSFLRDGQVPPEESGMVFVPARQTLVVRDAG